MTLSLPRPGVVPPGIAVPFVFDETIPQFTGSVDGVPGVFVVDTGNRSSLVLTSPFVAKNGLVKRYNSQVSGITGYGIGGPSSAILTRIKSLVVGSIDVPDVVTSLSTDTMGAMADPGIAGNVGGGFLKRFTVTFDYRNQIMYLQKNADFGKADIVDRSGLVLVAGKAGIRAIGVLSATPAARAGIHAGDIITGVNGAPASALGLARIRVLLRGPAGAKIRLSVLSAGQTRPVTLTLADYV
jgi:S1-C subfamily serine protease